MTDHAASVQGVALRVCKLDATGAPLTGTETCYYTSAFMSMQFTPAHTEGDEIEEKAADGTVCIYYKMPDTLKRVTFELAICSPDPELTEILIGGTLLEGANGATVNVTNKALTSNVATLTTESAHGIGVGDTITVSGVDSTFNGTFTTTSGTTGSTIKYAKIATDVVSAPATGTVYSVGVIGWAAPETGQESTPNGCAIEVWSKAIVSGKPAAVNPYWRWVFPYAQMKLSGDRMLENGAMANTFEGYGIGNSGFGTGPGADWVFNSDRAYQYARDAAVPVDAYGYVEIP